jgi:hypothetical protein
MFIPLDNKNFSKNLVIFPGLHYRDKNIINENINLNTITQIDNNIISENLFLKLYKFIDNTNNKQTQKKILKNKKKLTRKKQKNK